eukprot:6068209-Amphidinium_carterae.1
MGASSETMRSEVRRYGVSVGRTGSIWVAGDGGCLWHAVDYLLHNTWGSDHVTSEGHKFKAEMLSAFRADAGSFAGSFAELLGFSEPESVHDMCETWAPPRAWSDGRALIMLCAKIDPPFFVIDLDGKEMTIMHPQHKDWRLVTPWILQVTKQHYWPCQCTNLNVLRTICNSMNCQTVHSTSMHLRGGASDYNEAAFPRVHEEVGSPGSFLLASVNIGGWRTNYRKLLPWLEDYPCLCAVQETGLTSDGQKGMAAMLKDLHHEALFRAPACLKRSTRGQWRTAKGDTPGVALIHSKSLLVTQMKPKTEEFTSRVKEGRALIARLTNPASEHGDVLVVVNDSFTRIQASIDERSVLLLGRMSATKSSLTAVCRPL